MGVAAMVFEKLALMALFIGYYGLGMAAGVGVIDMRTAKGKIVHWVVSFGILFADMWLYT